MSIYNKFRKLLLLLKSGELHGFSRELVSFVKRRLPRMTYVQWVRKNSKSGTEIETERMTKFQENPLFSIVVPVFNTPKKYLDQMADSVIKQTYSNWELILVNGGSTITGLSDQLKKLAARDARIRIITLEKNLGISGNTNPGLKAAKGNFTALLDHDDILDQSALYEAAKAINEFQPDLIYSDEDKFSRRLSNRFAPHFKPDYNPELMHAYNYMSHLTIIRTDFIVKAGGLKSEYDGAQDYDLYLRIIDAGAKAFHIDKILYHWRAHKLSTAHSLSVKDYVVKATFKALSDHAKRIGRLAEVETGLVPGVYHLRYKLQKTDKVTIIIPNSDSSTILKRCIDSIIQKTTYKNYEVMIIDNNSVSTEIRAYYKQLEDFKRINVVHYPGEFNYAAINNWACNQVESPYYLFLNNDIEVITPDWIERMMEYCQFPENAAVGVKLYYPDNTVQHGGVIVGLGGVAGHAHKNFPRSAPGYMARLMVVQNITAVTAACMLVRAEAFAAVGGFNELYKVAFNDVDLCMKFIQSGYSIIWTPYAELYHHESLTRGQEDTKEKVQRFNSEAETFVSNWGLYYNDPNYNINLTQEKEDYSLSRKGRRK